MTTKFTVFQADIDFKESVQKSFEQLRVELSLREKKLLEESKSIEIAKCILLKLIDTDSNISVNELERQLKHSKQMSNELQSKSVTFLKISKSTDPFGITSAKRAMELSLQVDILFENSDTFPCFAAIQC